LGTALASPGLIGAEVGEFASLAPISDVAHAGSQANEAWIPSDIAHDRSEQESRLQLLVIKREVRGLDGLPGFPETSNHHDLSLAGDLMLICAVANSTDSRCVHRFGVRGLCFDKRAPDGILITT